MLADAKSILNSWGNYFNQLLNVHGEEEIEENNVQTPEVLVEMAIEKLKMYKASGIDGIPAELIKSGGEKLRENIHRLLILTNILVSRLRDHQCVFRRNRSTIDQIFSLRQILENKWEYNGTEKLYSILINFRVPKKLVGLIGMCLYCTKSRVRLGKQVSDNFEIHNGLKQGDALSPLLFNLVFEHAIKSLEDKEGVQLNGIHKLLVCADDMVLLGDNKEIRLEINVNKAKYMFTRRNASCNANGQLMTNEGNFKEVAEFKYLRKPEGKRPVGRPRMKWENNINHDLDVWKAYVRSAMNLRVR
ncbi:hypothetical protein C0J52_20676 [Blattella germanica]|nr:hypothetical protein C0J52_20676 [Blattella germanica]